MTTSHSGSCLCGAVRFEIDGAFEYFFLCHCQYCRKDTGSAHAANLFSSSGAVRWLAGREQVRDFRLPGTRHVRSFCATCGSALPRAPSAGESLVVPAGSLETDVSITPTGHLFFARRARWEDALAAAPRFDELPG